MNTKVLKLQVSALYIWVSSTAHDLGVPCSPETIQGRWPERGTLLVESCSWETHSSSWNTVVGNKLNSSVVLISLQPSAAAAPCAFPSACPTRPPTPWVWCPCSVLPGALSGTPRVLQAAASWRVSLSLASVTQVTKNQCTSKIH